MEISIIIPSKNDEYIFLQNYEIIKNYLENKKWIFEIILVSNGSSVDNLVLINDVIDSKFSHISLDKSGKGLAIKEGIKNAKYEYILFMDADCSVSINQLEKFIINDTPLGNVVIGTRRTQKSINKGSPLIRKVIGKVYLLFVRFLLGLNLTDTQCGFKLFRKDEFSKLKNLEFDNFSFDIEILYNFSKNNEIIEVPVDYFHNDNSKVSVFKDSFMMLIDLIKLRLR